MNFSGTISVLTSTNFVSGPVITAFSFSMKLAGTVALAGWVSGSLEDAAFCEPLPATADLFTGRGLDGRIILVTVHEASTSAGVLFPARRTRPPNHRMSIYIYSPATLGDTGRVPSRLGLSLSLQGSLQPTPTRPAACDQLEQQQHLARRRRPPRSSRGTS
jgi:hypothetical protein